MIEDRYSCLLLHENYTGIKRELQLTCPLFSKVQWHIKNGQRRLYCRLNFLFLYPLSHGSIRRINALMSSRNRIKNTSTIIPTIICGLNKTLKYSRISFVVSICALYL